MRRESRRRGYHIVRNQADADIVIAHSGGLFFTYPHPEKTILLIDPLTNVDSIAKDVLNHIWYDLKTLVPTAPKYYFAKTVCNILYVWNIPRWVRMAKRAPKAREYTAMHRRSIITSSNDQSYTSEADVPNAIQIDADHDDCWRNPGRYLDLI